MLTYMHVNMLKLTLHEDLQKQQLEISLSRFVNGLPYVKGKGS